MSLETHYCKLLALRSYKSPSRTPDECLPETLESGSIYTFLKSGQRIFDLNNPIPLHETQGDEMLSKPIALVNIIKATHHKTGDTIWTSGKYVISEVIPENKKLVWSNGRFTIE
ncbi:MAG: hypothetical protein WCK90_02475 [archaeon]